MRFFLCFWAVFFFVPQAFALNELAQGTACEKRIVALIDGAEKYIDAAVYSINRKSIVNALIAAQKRGVKIRLLTDRSQLASIKDMNDVERLMIAGIDVRIHTTKGLMHAKMAVFDGRNAVSGSFNWTDSAAEKNHEVCNLFMDDPAYAAQHQQLFDRFWQENPQDKSDRWLRMRGRCGDILLLRA